MNWKDFLLRLAGFVVISAAAMPVFAIIINALVLLSLVPTAGQTGFGTLVTTKAVFVWAACLPLGFAAIFIRERWRWILYLSPIYAPALFAILFTLMQRA